MVKYTKSQFRKDSVNTDTHPLYYGHTSRVISDGYYEERLPNYVSNKFTNLSLLTRRVNRKRYKYVGE